MLIDELKLMQHTYFDGMSAKGKMKNLINPNRTVRLRPDSTGFPHQSECSS